MLSNIFWHFLIFNCFLILSTFETTENLTGNADVSSGYFHVEETGVDHQSKNGEGEEDANMKFKNGGKQTENNYAGKMNEMAEEARTLKNFDEYRKVALPFIETITDDDKIQKCFNKVIDIKEFDEIILQFFKNASMFGKFVEHFNNRYKVIKGSKKTSKTLKHNFEILQKHSEVLKENNFKNFLEKIEMCNEKSYQSIYKLFQQNNILIEYSKQNCKILLKFSENYLGLKFENPFVRDLNNAINSQADLDELNSHKEKEEEEFKVFFDGFEKRKDNFFHRKLIKASKIPKKIREKLHFKNNNMGYERLVNESEGIPVTP
uniref:Uncharacterized protein n=2 Tax=Meloidogyne TaxID=189290 RepID=A0A6V7UL08_MELEN|nr:unnamed protein product [Meloidogyne enterolobii]